MSLYDIPFEKIPTNKRLADKEQRPSIIRPRGV